MRLGREGAGVGRGECDLAAELFLFALSRYLSTKTHTHTFPIPFI